MRQALNSGFPARAYPQQLLLADGRLEGLEPDRLHLSPKTVANYLTAVFAKLAVTDRSQAIVKARDAGLGRG